VSLRDKWERKKPTTGELPMAAMPDIAFLLLIFFMVSTTFLVSRTLEVELPAYSKQRTREKTKRVSVFLAADSLRVKYGDEAQNLDMRELEGYVRNVLASAEEASERVVLLEVHDECPYDRVVEVFDAIRAAGGYVSLVEPAS
jgi:biopolymer transport protein ExbD